MGCSLWPVDLGDKKCLILHMVLRDMLTLHKNGLRATTALQPHSGEALKEVLPVGRTLTSISGCSFFWNTRGGNLL